MNTKLVRLSCHWWAVGFQCVMVVLVAASAAAQGRGSVDEAISEIKSGHVDPVVLQRLARAHAVEAINPLREQFARTQDDLLKDAIASTLVRLGVEDRSYWDYLEQNARKAIESDAPFPSAFDVQGHAIRKQLSPEFLEWAKRNQLDVQQAVTIQMQRMPAQVSFLAATRDPRATELLRRAMASRNYLVEAVAARGLASLQDSDSVSLIVTACRRAPSEAAELVARSLVFFQTPQAQSAAESFIQNPETLDQLRKLSKEKGSSVLF
ncbi:MAG TPA: hypothetical protein VE783_00850 [Candidatus Limnocylindrales bacterium]|nr:hypothetical protein [Candidatus Limnocylindrales bacterium]